MIIKAALNGGRTRSEHPAIPITPQELAASAKESVAAGAGAIHFHVRGVDGRESLEPEDISRALAAIRSAASGTPTGVSTGAWILRDTKLRYETISRWKVLPDFASVNFNEDGAVPLAELLLSLGVPIEAGLSDVKGTQVFVKSGLAPRCLRILVEALGQEEPAALKTVEDIVQMLDRADLRTPRVLHGSDQLAWRLIDEAAARKYDTRVGLEDILTLPDGNPAPGNGALVAEAARRMRKPAGC
jgi:uncharacterized protein (DUF849 family)